MSATPFPLPPTANPQVDVTLGVGDHRFKLVVVDADGVASEPAYVSVRVRSPEPDPPPEIDYLDPAHGTRSQNVDALIIGRHLQPVTRIRVFREGTPKGEFTVTQQPGAGAGRVPVTIHVTPDADLGPYTLQLETPAGSGFIPFVVVSSAKPRITHFAPGAMTLGSGLVPARITGDHLAETNKVELYVQERLDTSLQVTLRETDANNVDLDIRVPVDAPLGLRRIKVTTPSGEAISRGDASLAIRPGLLQLGIMGLGVAAALLHLIALPWLWLVGVTALYLILLFLRYASLPELWPYAARLRWGLIAFTLLVFLFAPPIWRTPALWPDGLLKAVEGLLLVLLLAENYRATGTPPRTRRDAIKAGSGE